MLSRSHISNSGTQVTLHTSRLAEHNYSYTLLRPTLQHLSSTSWRAVSSFFTRKRPLLAGLALTLMSNGCPILPNLATCFHISSTGTELDQSCIVRTLLPVLTLQNQGTTRSRPGYGLRSSTRPKPKKPMLCLTASAVSLPIPSSTYLHARLRPWSHYLFPMHKLAANGACTVKDGQGT